MKKSFEDNLQNALRPRDPGEDFTQSVMAKLPIQASPPAGSGSFVFGVFGRRPPWIAAALAASVIVVIAIRFEVQEHRDHEAGLRAREQVLEALQVTSEKLNIAYRVVHDQSQPRDPSVHNSGA